MTKQVLNMIRPEYSSDDITRAVKEILSEEGSRQRRVDEIAQELLMFLWEIHVQRRKRLF